MCCKDEETSSLSVDNSSYLLGVCFFTQRDWLKKNALLCHPIDSKAKLKLRLAPLARTSRQLQVFAWGFNWPQSPVTGQSDYFGFGHFRLILCLWFKTSLPANPLLRKGIWFAWKWTCWWNSFAYEWFLRKTRFGKKAKSNSEKAHCKLL